MVYNTLGISATKTEDEVADEGIETGAGPSEFGRWLYETRTAAKLSVGDLADKAGTSWAQIYNLESGRSQNPQAATRKKLTDALGQEPAPAVVKATEESATVEDVGEFVDFDPHDEASLPPEAGVYVFYDISDRPLYVGQSQNIRDRIARSHVEKFWFRAPVVQSAAFVKIEDEELRKRIEKIMIKFMRTNAVLNKQYVERKT